MPGGAWPEEATVDLWVAPLDLPADGLDRLAASLSAGERRRAARYRSPADGRRFTAARGWLRHVLGAALGVEPAAVPVSEDAGKPRLPAGGPRFNVSHSGELVVVAVAPFEVGVDVEHAGRRWADVVALACAPEEVAALAAHAGDEREDGFLALWTAKEAYLKATGEGLAVDPRRVVVGRPAPGRAAAVSVDGAPTGWWVRPVVPAGGYVGAVAARGTGWDVRLRPAAELGRAPAGARP